MVLATDMPTNMNKVRIWRNLIVTLWVGMENLNSESLRVVDSRKTRFVPVGSSKLPISYQPALGTYADSVRHVCPSRRNNPLDLGLSGINWDCLGTGHVGILREV